MIKTIVIHTLGGALLSFLLFKFTGLELLWALFIGFGAALLSCLSSLKINKSTKK